MQPLDSESNFYAAGDECAVRVLETIPYVMGSFRAEMRSNRPSDLSVPQFRALIFLHHHCDVSLSEVAEQLGLTLPSASKLVNGLVKRELVTRQISAEDRRRAVIALTSAGRSTLQTVWKHAVAHLTEHFSVLSEDERQEVMRAMWILQRAFARVRDGKVGGSR